MSAGKIEVRDFPGGPMVKTPSFCARDAGSICGLVAKIPHTSWPRNRNIKQKHSVTNRIEIL